jgi:hypothetical protein
MKFKECCFRATVAQLNTSSLGTTVIGIGFLVWGGGSEGWFFHLNIFLCQYSDYILTLNSMCILVPVEKFVVGGVVWAGWWVECVFSVMVWSKPFLSGLSFRLGTSWTINFSKGPSPIEICYLKAQDTQLIN